VKLLLKKGAKVTCFVRDEAKAKALFTAEQSDSLAYAVGDLNEPAGEC
jgi:uncharacterized protein YbjT (DUF2867 family)